MHEYLKRMFDYVGIVVYQLLFRFIKVLCASMLSVEF